MIQTGIFEDLQRKIDEDSSVKDVGFKLIHRRCSALMAMAGSA